MQLVHIENSSNIDKLGFEENRKISLSSNGTNVLRIVFKSGSTYDYYGVSKETFDEFLKAGSKGKFFWANIDNKYKFEKV